MFISTCLVAGVIPVADMFQRLLVARPDLVPAFLLTFLKPVSGWLGPENVPRFVGKVSKVIYYLTTMLVDAS